MTVMLMVVLGASAIAFYLRFLAALCLEHKPHVGGYWVRLRIETDEDRITAREQRRVPASRAA